MIPESIRSKYFVYNKCNRDRKTWKSTRILSAVSSNRAEIKRSEPDNPNCGVCKDRGYIWEPRRTGRSRLVSCGCKTNS